MAEDNSHPGPDEFLALAEGEKSQKGHGKLKIFLGYAPGVGKTYAMLEAARQRKNDTDVVVACVETHSRTETDALLEGFEVLPRKIMMYQGTTLSEMDIDAVLARRPQLAIVDNLAHDNAAGSRHPKRYQDVEELLASGIDVYTTLNVQHIESGRNVVAQITNVWVRQTVPDSIIDSADEIELVDLPPDELIKRFKEGKIYVPEQIAAVTEQFFHKGNLIALRELTMRTAAKHVDEQAIAYMKSHAIHELWPSTERLLLFLGPGSAGSHLVRSTRRLAHELAAEWSVIYVETPESVRLLPEQLDRIMNSLRLAQRLGAKIATIQGDDVATTVIDYARVNNTTKIIMAKAPKAHLFSPSVTDQIIRQSENIGIYLVGGGEPTKPGKSLYRKISGDGWQGYLLGLGLVVLATLLGNLMHEFFTPTTIAMLYVLCVVISAYRWGLGPAILTSVTSALAFEFFHIPPYLTFVVGDVQYLFTLFALLLVGGVISYLATRLHRQSELASKRECQTAALYALGQDLATSNDLDSYILAIMKRAKDTLGHDVMVFLPDAGNRETLTLYGAGRGITVSNSELAAATWAFQHRRPAGTGTDTMPDTKARYIPLVTARGAVGVISLSMAEGGKITTQQERLLEAYADLAAVSLESILPKRETG